MIGMIYMRTSELEQEISLDNSVIKKPIKKHSILFQKQNIFYLLLFLFILGIFMHFFVELLNNIAIGNKFL